MTKICRLMSTVEDIPHQTIRVGECLAIGRNRRCRIRDLKCSRSDCLVTFDGINVCVVNNNTNKSQNLSNGQFLAGNGFRYKVVIIDDNNGSNGGQLGHSLDEKHMSCEESVKPLITDSKINSSTTLWQSLYSSRVHICHFLGGGQNSGSVAAFDFDGTLVKTKSGNNFAIDSSDWKLIDTSLPKRIKTLIDNGFRFVIISNQLPLSQGRYKLEDIQKRFEGAMTAIGCPCLVLIAAFDDIYRKPRPGLWQLLAEELNNKPIDLTTSFYVGDAAGRKKQLNGKSDHSSVDLLFAANSGLPFLTPEGFFSNSKPKGWDMSKKRYSGFEITTYRPNRSEDTFICTELGSNQRFVDINDVLDKYSGKPHSIVFCGLPASGKTSFYNNYLKELNYFYISRDELKTMEKCQKKFECNLKNKQNSVIDNINVTQLGRKQWLDICRRHSTIALLFFFDGSVEQSLHNNKFRKIIGINTPVTDLVIRSQNKNFVKPTPDEGFDAVYKINFVPKFAKREQELIYYMFLSER